MSNIEQICENFTRNIRQGNVDQAIEAYGLMVKNKIQVNMELLNFNPVIQQEEEQKAPEIQQPKVQFPNLSEKYARISQQIQEQEKQKQEQEEQQQQQQQDPIENSCYNQTTEVPTKANSQIENQLLIAQNQGFANQSPYANQNLEDKMEEEEEKDDQQPLQNNFQQKPPQYSKIKTPQPQERQPLEEIKKLDKKYVLISDQTKKNYIQDNYPDINNQQELQNIIRKCQNIDQIDQEIKNLIPKKPAQMSIPEYLKQKHPKLEDKNIIRNISEACQDFQQVENHIKTIQQQLYDQYEEEIEEYELSQNPEIQQIYTVDQMQDFISENC